MMRPASAGTAITCLAEAASPGSPNGPYGRYLPCSTRRFHKCDSDSRFCSTRPDSAPSSATRQVDRPPHNAHKAHHLVRAPAHAQKAPLASPLCACPGMARARLSFLQACMPASHRSSANATPSARLVQSASPRWWSAATAHCRSAHRLASAVAAHLPSAAITDGDCRRPRADAPQMTRFKVPSSPPVWRRRTGKQDAAAQTFAN